MTDKEWDTQKWQKLRRKYEPHAKEMAVCVKNELMQPGGILEQWSWAWLADALTRNNRAEIEVVDCGYDCSSYGHRTNQPFCISDFNTVRDFLDEPTGNTVATYASGSGMAAERYEDCFYQDTMEKIRSWVEEQGYVEGLDEYEADAAWDALVDASVVADAYEAWWIECFFYDKPFDHVRQFCRLRVVC